MVRVRKLVLAIAAASALTSGTAYALGLGEIDLQSSLSQPLVAEIELLEVRDLASTEVIPTLASPEEFNKAGVDRQYFLTDLKFTPVIKPNGRSVIRITSTKPVREPYLNFLVEVLWPNGRLLREYTLLLDPPLYTPQSVTAPRMPVAAAPVPRPITAPASRPVTPTANVPSRPVAPSAPAASKIDGDQYKTTSSDTLWEIAQRSRQGGTVHQAMLAIQDLNPNAFLDGNINRLKSGQVLRLPTDEQIQSRSQSEAIAQVNEQNNAWREGRSVAAGSRQLDATKRASAGAAPATTEAKDNLKLVSAESGKNSAGSDRGNGDTKALSDQLAVTKESLDSSRRENEELKGRVGDLQGQLDKLQRLIELKDNQLAKLQADLAQQGTAAPVAPTPAPGAEVASPESKPADASEPIVESKPVEPAPADNKPATTDFNYNEEAAPKTESVEPVEPVAETPAAQPVTPAPKPAEPIKPAPAKPAASAPAPAPEPEAQGLIDKLLGNPMLLGVVGGGALLLLLIALMVLSRRNAMKEAELQDGLDADDTGTFASEMDLPDDSFAGFDEASDATQVREQADERVAPQTADALGEADIYIAYGKFTQAAELLNNAINDEPHRSDLRLKLMEVYAELGDREGFIRQEQELREIGGSAGAVDQLKAKYPAMAVAVAAGGLAAAANADDDLGDFSLDDLTLDEPAPVSQPASDLDDSFDLSLDDLEVNLDEPAAVSPQAETALDDLELNSGLDFEAPASGAPDNTEMDFDLDLSGERAGSTLSLEDDLADFSLDLESDSKTTAAPEEDFMLSLDDEPTAPSAESDLDMPSDFDLSLADEAPATDSFAAQLDEVSAELDELSGSLDDELSAVQPEAPAAATELDVDDDFDFLSGTDETATKLDLARAYIDMGDSEGARDILDEVIAEGSEGQQQEARELISKLS